jgi:energy-coupling factor transporter ATP-binding protein EcfA2
VLSLVGLAARGRVRLRPGALAPGERQRLALAVALANRPGLLLADEPTSQLDTHARDEVVSALDAVRRNGTTVVMVTHDPDVGVQMGRTITIRDGRVGAEGRRGEDYAVIGRDGSVHLPPEVLKVVPPGTLLRVHAQPDGSIVLTPPQSQSATQPAPAAPGRALTAGPDGAATASPGGPVSTTPAALEAPRTGDGVHSNAIILGTAPAPNGGIER